MSENALLTAAHDYRARGWRVIQLHKVGPDGVTCSCMKGGNCPSKGKHPIDNGWQNTPPLSAADIEALWEKMPKANVGIATGEASGFWVLDIDPKSGGMESMAELVTANGKLPQTFTVKTGSGGYHYYFAMPGFPVTNSAGQLKGTGIDVRGTGGQVVAAPSRSDKGDYAVAVDAPVAPAPDWLLELIKPAPVTTPIVTSSDVPDRSHLDPAEQARLDGYADKAIKSCLSRVQALSLSSPLPSGGWDGEPWNHTTFETACQLIEIANSPWNVYTRQQAHEDLFLNAPRDTQGFDDEAVIKCWNSAVQKVGDKARAIPATKAEPVDFFAGPDVRTDAPKSTPEVPSSPELAPGRKYDPAVFFDPKDGLKTTLLSKAIMADEPIAYGGDKSFWVYRDGVWISEPEIVEGRVYGLLADRFRDGQIRTMEKAVKHDARRISCGPVEDFINFQNGMLNWRTGKLLEHDESYGSTVQMNAPYEPDAECPMFDAFLDGTLSKDYIDIVWEMIGYLMYSGNPLQIAFMFYGGGGNGKGTLIHVIEKLLGTESIAAQSLDQLNSSRFSSVNLFGKSANIAGDIDATYQESTANFKKLTGGDTISAERKFGQPFSFMSWAVPLFSANKIPGSADVSEGYLRRWVTIEFLRHFSPEERDIDLEPRLMTELTGIAAHGVRALRPLMARKFFDPKGDALGGKERFAEAVDAVRRWVRQGAIEAPGTFTPTTELYADYISWAARNNLGKLGSTEFTHRLDAIGFKQSRQGVEGYIGLMVSGTATVNGHTTATTIDTLFDRNGGTA